MKPHLPRTVLIPCLLTVLAVQGAAAPAPPAGAARMDVPAAPGSFGANLATGPGGETVLSWIEPGGDGHALRYAVLDENAWGDAELVASGDDWFANWADFPSVVPLSDELWAAHWLVRQSAGGYAYDVVVSLSKDAGASWSEPVTPHDDRTPTEHGFVTFFPRGDGVGLVWLDGRHTLEAARASAVVHGTTLRAATVTPELTIVDGAEVDGLTCDCCQTDVVSVPGGAVAVYRDRSAGEIRDIAAARLTAGGWQPGHVIAEDGWHITGCPVNGPVIAADGTRLAVAWFTAAGARQRIRLARSDDGGATWSAPLDVARGDTTGHAGIAMLPHGAVAVSWVCEQPEGAAVCVRAVSAGGEPGPLRVPSGDARVPLLSVPQLARDGDRLVLAWTQESGGITHVASATLAIAALQ